MAKEPSKLKARLPRGLMDRGPAELAAERTMLETIRTVFERYGFEAVETPAIEYTDALGKFLPDQDRPNEGVFSFQDEDEQWLSLRYDLTAPLARYVAENFDRLPKPYRSYRVGYVFRNEKPGPGRYRQFLQFDADTVGASSVAADAEMCMLAADTLEALDLKGNYVIKVSNRKILDGVMDALGLSGETNVAKRLAVLRAIDKLDRLGPEGVKLLLGKGRKDESGDFTKGAGLDTEQIDVLLAFLEIDVSHNPSAALAPRENPALANMKGGILYRMPAVIERSARFGTAILNSKSFIEGINDLDKIRLLVESNGYGPDRIETNFSVVRGLEYYTGPVYEADLTFQTKDGARFGSVAGGGRYDGLVARFRGEAVPATGFSIGVSRLMAALQHLGKLDTKTAAGPVVVTVLDKPHIAKYQSFVKQLRDVKIRAELYLGDGRLGAQTKYADRRGSPCVVIQGEDERNHKDGPQIVVKDLILGKELSKLEAGREEYLQKQVEAQLTVSEDKLVETVRKVLARHSK